MNDQKSVETAMWVMILVQTLGALDMPGSGPRKMPAPGIYVPVIISFFVLDIIADAGYGRAAKAMGWLSVLAAIILGPFGGRVVTFLNSISTEFSSPLASPVQQPSSSQPGFTG